MTKQKHISERLVGELRPGDMIIDSMGAIYLILHNSEQMVTIWAMFEDDRVITFKLLNDEPVATHYEEDVTLIRLNECE